MTLQASITLDKKAILMGMVVIALLVCAAASPLFGQQGNLQGQVEEKINAHLIPGAYLVLDGGKKWTTCDKEGKFIFENLPIGIYSLEASSIGYESYSILVEIVADSTVNLIIGLLPKINQLSQAAVITGGNEGLQDIPGSVSYLTPKDLAKFSYTDVNRSLRQVPGLNIQEEDGFGLRPNIGLRGTGSERSSKITLMEDGILIAPAPYSAPAAYYFPTIGRMQGIEILKGSSQIKYGPYTTGGAINLISTQIPDSLSGQVKFFGGSFKSANLHAYLGDTQGRISYLLETFQYNSNGFKVLDNGGNTGFDKEDYLAKIGFQSSDSARFHQAVTLKLSSTHEVSNETYLGLAPDDFETTPFRRYAASQKDQMHAQHRQISLHHQISWSPQVKTSTTAYASTFERNWYKLGALTDSVGNKYGIASLLLQSADFNHQMGVLAGNSSDPGELLWVKANNRSYYSRGIQSATEVFWVGDRINHNIEMGMRYHEDAMDKFQWQDAYVMHDGNMELSESGIPGTESNKIEYASAWAFYLQDKIKLNKLTLIPGLRQEFITSGLKDYGRNDVDRSGVDFVQRISMTKVLVPGLGVDYKWSNYTSVFGGIHQGFSPPGSREGVNPEKSINYELGARNKHGAWDGEWVLFFNQYSNLLGSDLSASGGQGTTQMFNAGKVNVQGMEFRLGWDFVKDRGWHLPIQLTYTYTEATFMNTFDSDFDAWGNVSAGDHFPYLAHHQGTALLGWSREQLELNLSCRYVDSMRTSPGQGVVSEQEKIDSYFVVDFGISLSLKPQISLFANVNNLTNEVYVVAKRPAGLRPGLPRFIQCGLLAKF